MLLALSVVALLLVAAFVTGLVATLEDEAPGGLRNPDGGTPAARFGRRSGAVLRGTGVVLGALGGLYFLATARPAASAAAPFGGSLALGIGLLVLSGVLAWGGRRAR